MSRPSSFTPEVADEICERLAVGESLRAICREDRMPSQTSIFRWLESNETFREQYTRARAWQVDCFSEDIVEIADTCDDPAKARVQIDARKWFASKVAPKKYGDKITTEHTGTLNLAGYLSALAGES